ncbi:MAG: tetratricopeptide repeat protein [Candidatus Auribacterota bacterium]
MEYSKSSEKTLRLYEKAQEAFKRNNLDYAIKILITVVEFSPQFIKARHLLRLIEMKKLERSKAVLLKRFIGNMLSIPYYPIAYFYFYRGQYDKALSFYEKILLNDPVNIIVLTTLGNSALALDMVDTAIETFETIRRIIPSHIKNLMKLGTIYKDRTGELEKAKECFTTILQYDKENHAARKAVSDVSALQTIETGSYDDLSSSFLTKVKDLDYTDIAEKKMRAVKSEEDLQILIKDTEEAHRQEPQNSKTIIELASYYLQAKDYQSAIAYYKKALDLTPEDYTIVKMIMNAEMSQFDNTILELAKSALPSKEKEQQIKELETEKRKVAEYYLEHIVEQKPADKELRYQLGRLYFEMNKIDKAIKEFQLAVQEPRYRLRAHNYLGLCFMAAKMFDLAEVQFTTALKESGKNVMDTFTKEIIYNLAAVYENTGHIGKAVDQYKEIYKVDIGFKDVADKIRQTYHS